MIAGCREESGRTDCRGCEREDACARLMRRFGAALFERPVRRNPAARPLTGRSGSPILALFGEIARNVGRNAGKSEGERPAPAGAFRREVERRIEALLPSEARMEKVASELGCSRQTLYRRLKAEGVTFEILLDRVRHRLALRLVRRERLSVKEAAYRLGFAEPAAFSRAFKRWTGASPSAMRQR